MADYEPVYRDQRFHRDIRRVGDHFEQYVGTKDFGYRIIFDEDGNEIDRVDIGEAISEE